MNTLEQAIKNLQNTVTDEQANLYSEIRSALNDIDQDDTRNAKVTLEALLRRLEVK